MRAIGRNTTLGSNLGGDGPIADQLCEDDAAMGRPELSWMRGKGRRSGTKWTLLQRNNKLVSARDSALFRDSQVAMMFTITAATRRQIRFTLWS
jgi:hypothetical protein